jgi:hypothetical protein
MYLFSRRGRVTAGAVNDALAWAAQFPGLVKNVSGLDVELWSQVLSPEVGTLAWTTFVPDIATLETAMDKLQADPTYVAEGDRGLQFMPGGIDDNLAVLVHGDLDPERRLEYVMVTEGRLASGRMGKGISTAVEISTKVQEITGIPASVFTSTTGAIDEVAWMVGYTNVAEMDTATAAIAGDPSFTKFIDERSEVFAAGSSAVSLLYRRIV